MEPGTLPPAVSSRSAGAAPSRFSVPAKTPSSRRSPAPGSPTAPAAPAGSPPGSDRSPLPSPSRSRLCLAFSLPPPPAPQSGTHLPSPYPRGSSVGPCRCLELYPPRMGVQEAAGTVGSFLSSATRGCGAPRIRVALRRLRGRGGCSAGSSAAPRGTFGTVPPACTGDTRSEGVGLTPSSPGCGPPADTGHGPSRPRMAPLRRRSRCLENPKKRSEAAAASVRPRWGARPAPRAPSPRLGAAPAPHPPSPSPGTLCAASWGCRIRSGASTRVNEPPCCPALINND